MLYAMDGAVQADESDVTSNGPDTPIESSEIANQNVMSSDVENKLLLGDADTSEFNNGDFLQNYDQSETRSMETKSVESKELFSLNSENMESSNVMVSADFASAPDSTPTPASNDNNISGVSFEDVADYGNTASVTGVIQYDLMISEINTQEQRKIIQDSITDSRFKWNVDEVMSLVTKGQLVLKDLDPVTTHIIVQRIKDLKVEISWSQHVM